MKDKKRLLQMVVLGILVAACAGYVVMNLFGTKTSAASPPPAAQASAKPAPAPGTEKDAAATDGQPEVSAVVVPPEAGAPVPARGRDPFAPAMDISTRMVMARAPNVRIPDNLLPPYNPPVAGVQTPSGAQPPGVQQVDPGGQKPVEEPFPAFVVTGIITGRKNVAIVRLGEGRYIVSEGQKINGAYQVVSVSQEGVLLERDGRSVFLKLGGEPNAS